MKIKTSKGEFNYVKIKKKKEQNRERSERNRV